MNTLGRGQLSKRPSQMAGDSSIIGFMTIESSTIPVVQYRRCRWYDTDPQFIFVLDVVKLLPLAYQAELGTVLLTFLTQRQVDLQAPLSASKRWYDAVPTLSQAMQALAQAPEAIRQQASEHLLKAIQQFHHYPSCA